MKLLVVIMIILNMSLFAQNNDKIDLSGSLNIDQLIASKNVSSTEDEKMLIDAMQKRTPILAAVMSLAVPGAGQFYNEDYIKGGILFLIDAAALTTAIIYDGKGNDQTDYFESFAEAHWDVRAYARWTMNNATRINPEVDPSQFNVFNGDDVNWGELNRLENAVGNYYSHQLAGYQEQQYYEMIGKYTQFNPGWDDFTEDPDDPFTYTHTRKDPLTERFIYYAGQRGEANDFYNTASKAVLVMVVNHIISAVEAAWTSAKFNKKIDAGITLEKTTYGLFTDIYPSLHVRLNL
ncbi:MAG: hypothetical protein KKA84_11345 [Bacteroidetes bacterium]|nr:hypothetical protein [Bacteroidota bacterium]